MKSNCLYQKKFGRLHFLFRLLNFPVRIFLKRASKHYIHKNYRQIATFSFDYIGNQISVNGIFEKDELDTLFSWIRDSNFNVSETTALDIGANIGNHSLYFSDYFSKVICLEPNPRTFSLLKFNTELNERIQCLNIGLSDSEETLTLYCPAYNAGQASMTPITSENIKEYNVKVMPLDSLHIADKIGFIKIDVEGHEYKVLSGARETILANKPIIVFEQHKNEIVNGSSKVIELLRSYGYQNFASISQREEKYSKSIQMIFCPILRLLFGDKTEIVYEYKFKSKFYSMLAAIPSPKK